MKEYKTIVFSILVTFINFNANLIKQIEINI